MWRGAKQQREGVASSGASVSARPPSGSARTKISGPVNVPAKSGMVRSTSQKELQPQMGRQIGRDRSFSLDSASVEVLNKCSKTLRTDSDSGSSGQPVEPSQGPSDHLPRPDGDNDAVPGGADEVLSPQAAPSRKERLDPFDFVGRRQHVSCSLEDFEAMRERPACASPTKEDSFCLCDDRGAAATNKFLLQNLLVTDPCTHGGPIVYVSDGVEKLTGYRKDQMLGRNAKLFQGLTDEPDAAVADIRAAITDKRRWMGQLRNFRKDETPFQNLLLLQPLLNADGEVHLWLGVQFDVTDGTCGGQALTPALLQSIEGKLEAALAGALMTEPSTSGNRITFVNEGHEKLSGYAPDDLIGLGWTAEYGTGTQARAVEQMLNALHKNVPIQKSLLQYRKTGEPYWAFTSLVPIWEGSVEGNLRGHLWLKGDVTYPKAKRIGKYILGREIGAGASGSVFLGKDSKTAEVVAIKIVDASKFKSIVEIERIQEEIRILTELHHPNIIHMKESLFVNDCFYFIMEYAEGGCLTSLLKHGAVCEERARELLTDTLKGLEYCHRRNIAHRDLKSENLLLDGNGTVKVADFGLSTILTAGCSGMSLKCGTPAFQAPEIFRGLDYSPAVDMWSLGVILYEMVTGTLPFQGKDRKELHRLVCAGSYVEPPGMSAHCRRLLRKMLRVHPDQRATIAELWRQPWFGLHDDLDDPESLSQSSAERGSANRRNRSCSLDTSAFTLLSSPTRSLETAATSSSTTTTTATDTTGKPRLSRTVSVPSATTASCTRPTLASARKASARHPSASAQRPGPSVTPRK